MLEELLHLSWMASFGLVAGLYVLYLLVGVLLDPLRDIPGPFLARFTRWWYVYAVWKGEFEQTNIALHKKYGPIVRLAPNDYSLDDPEAAKVIYSISSNFLKGSWYKPFIPPTLANYGLFASINPNIHTAQRRKFANAYTMTSIVGYEPYVDSCSALFATQLRVLASSQKAFNFGHWLQFYAFDVIGEITFGNRFGFLQAGEDKHGVFKGIEQRTAYSTFVGHFPWIHPWLFPLLPKTGGHAYVGNYTAQQMEGRQKSKAWKENDLEKEGAADFMTKFLAVHEADPDKFSKTDLFAVCLSNIGAGSDTTGTTLSAIFYHLLKHPESYAKLREEIDAAAAEGRISDPVTFKESQDELPYLQAVIREALRINPATTSPLVRVVPSGGATLAGRFFPAGSTVGINGWVAHRNKSVFGQDAEEWRPERWLEIESDPTGNRGKEIEKYFFAFGMGSRTCIGKNISLLEMGKLVPQIVRRFNLSLGGDLVQKGRKWRTESRWFIKPLDFEVVAVERKDFGKRV